MSVGPVVSSVSGGETRTARFPSAKPALILMLVPIVFFAVSSIVTQPFVFPDESGAITNARYLAGRGPRSPWWYLPGYGALLAPVLAFTRSLRTISLAIHLLNAALGAITAAGLFVTGRRLFPRTSPRVVAVAAVVTCMYPAYLYSASLAMADNLILAGSVWSVVIVDRIRSHPASISSVSLALLLGLFTTVHSRAALVVVAAVVVLAIGPRTRGLAILAAFTAATMLMLARLAIDTTDQSVLLVGQVNRNGIGGLLRANASASAIAVLPLTLLGHLLNLATATAGVVVLGGACVVRLVRSGDRRSRLSGVQISLMVLGTGVASALFANQQTGDFTVYGRYIEAVMALPLFLGLLRIMDRPVPAWFGRFVPAGLVLAGLLLLVVRGYDAFEGRTNYLNLGGIAVIVASAGRINPVLIASVGALLSVLVWRLSLIAGQMAVAALVVVFVLNASFLYLLAATRIDIVAEQNELTPTIQQAIDHGASPCVGLDQSALDNHWAHENYRVHNLDIAFEFWQSATDQDVPCPDLVVSSRADLAARLPGWRPIAWEHVQPHWLWVSPTALAALGDKATPAQFAENDGRPLSAELAIAETAAQASPNDSLSLTITIVNHSDFVFVPPSYMGSETNSVRIALEWQTVEPSIAPTHLPFMVDLVEPLRPGRSQEVEVSIPRHLDDLAVGDGAWLILAEVIREPAGSGGATADLRVHVESS